MGMKDCALQNNIILAKRNLQRVETQLNSGNLPDGERAKLEKVGQELRDKLTCFGEQRDEMMGLGVECKNPPKPVLECGEPEQVVPSVNKGLLETVSEKGIRGMLIDD